MRGICIALLFAQALGADALSSLAGPVTPLNTSPWAGYDSAEFGNIRDVATSAASNTPTPGAEASATGVLHDGCNVTVTTTAASEFTSSTSHFLILVNTTLHVHWVMGFDPTAISGTTITSGQCGLLSYWHGVADGATVHLFHCEAFCGLDSGSPQSYSLFWWRQGSAGAAWTFYDLGAAVYRYYLRSGNSTYLTMFRTIADAYIDFGISAGMDRFNPPRDLNILTAYIRALDGRPELFPALAAEIDDISNTSFYGFFIPGWFMDNREYGYVLLANALAAIADPDSTRHTHFCSVLAGAIPTLLALQQPQGFWTENNFGFAMRFPGIKPWGAFALAQGLARSYDVLADTSAAGCNNPTLAASVLTATSAFGEFLYTYSRGTFRGVYYNTMSPTNVLGQANQSGTVSGARSGNTITGVGTSFTTAPWGSGTKWIGINNSNQYFVYQVANITDDTHLTTVTNLSDAGAGVNPGTDFSNLGWTVQYPASTACNGTTPYCEGESRNNVRDLVWIMGWLYKTTLLSKWKSYGDEYFSSSYGYAAAGVGQNYPALPGPCGGPACDGTYTDYIEGIGGCSFNPALPCSPDSQFGPPTFISNAFVELGKRFNQGSGIGGADNYLSWRLLGLTAQSSLSGTASLVGTASIH